MKQTITQYVISDPDKKLFWMRNTFYHPYKDDNLYAAWFSDMLSEANYMCKKYAEDALESFHTGNYIHAAVDSTVNFKNLIIVPITITYKL